MTFINKVAFEKAAKISQTYINLSDVQIQSFPINQATYYKNAFLC